VSPCSTQVARQPPGMTCTFIRRRQSGQKRGRDLAVGQAEHREDALFVQSYAGFQDVGGSARKIRIDELRHAGTLQV
jgi:hypothetical protein